MLCMYVLFVLCPCHVLCVLCVLTCSFSLLHSQVGVYKQGRTTVTLGLCGDKGHGSGECVYCVCCMYFLCFVLAVCCVCCVCCVYFACCCAWFVVLCVCRVLTCFFFSLVCTDKAEGLSGWVCACCCGAREEVRARARRLNRCAFGASRRHVHIGGTEPVIRDVGLLLFDGVFICVMDMRSGDGPFHPLRRVN